MFFVVFFVDVLSTLVVCALFGFVVFVFALLRSISFINSTEPASTSLDSLSRLSPSLSFFPRSPKSQVNFMSNECSSSKQPRSIQETQDSSPACVVRIPRSTSTRLIVFFNKYGLCRTGEGLCQFNTRVPEELKEHDIDEELWIKWATKSRQEIQPLLPSLGVMILLVMGIVTIPLAYIKVRRYKRAMLEWLRGFNKEVLEPKGLYGATQTGVFQAYRFREEVSWLAIATTPAEAAALAQEPHIWLYNPCTSHLFAPSCCCRAMACAPETCCGQQQVI